LRGKPVGGAVSRVLLEFDLLRCGENFRRKIIYH
jgi:hypothetical protein